MRKAGYKRLASFHRASCCSCYRCSRFKGLGAKQGNLSSEAGQVGAGDVSEGLNRFGKIMYMVKGFGDNTRM